MKLNYDEFYKLRSMLTDVESAKSEYVVNSILNRREKLAKKQMEINDLVYEKFLIENDIVEIVKNDLSYCSYNIFNYFNGDLLFKAWKYTTLKEEEKDEDEKTCYEFALSRIKKCLVPEKYQEKVKFGKIIDLNYNNAFQFEISVDKIEFAIEVPNFNNVTTSNYMDFVRGYKLRQEDDHVISIEFEELNPSEFQKKLEEWLDNKIKESKKK